MVLAIKDDDQETAAASDGPLERFTFDFLLHSDDEGGKQPSRDEVDLCSRAFAACLSKIAFADALLAPLPQAAMNQGRLSFEIVAYATRSGVSASMAAGDEWSEERVGAGVELRHGRRVPRRRSGTCSFSGYDGAEVGVRGRGPEGGGAGEERGDAHR